MTDIEVEKKNHTFLKVKCDPGIAMELSEHFSFYVNGYQFMPAFKKKYWDGKIRLFNNKTNEIYTGLYSELVNFASDESRGYSIRPVQTRYGTPGERDVINSYNYYINPDELDNFLTSLNPHVKKKKIDFYPYQKDAILSALNYQQRLLVSPTASGKSLIIYSIARYFLEHEEGSLLIVVPTTSLVRQMYDDFADYSSEIEWDVEENCHMIYGGKDKRSKKRVIISTWQSVYKEPTEYFSKFKAVIGDEAHHFKAKSLTTIMEKCNEAFLRIGTTGTLDDTLTHQLVLEGLFGKAQKIISTHELMEGGQVSQMEIEVLLMKYPEIYRKGKKRKYQDEIDFLVTHEPRNNFIKNLALGLEGNTLILFNLVEKHGKVIYDMISKATTRNVYFVAGEVDVDQREHIRKIVEKEKDAIIVASLGTFSTGVNIRNLHNLILAAPTKAKIKLLQSIGRILRKVDFGKTVMIVYDIADDLSWKDFKNYTLNHSAQRISYYAREKFKFKINQVKLK